MASGPGSRAEETPPALPVKQHRSHSFRGSSVESDSSVFSPVGLQYQNCAWNDVFPEPTDCHAAQCPIHQRYDPSQHLMRFFSDGTPPPVPKKRLTRTLSLPGTDPRPPLSPLSPLSPRERHPQNFDNPLYMLAPIPDTHFHEEIHDFKPVRESPVPLPSLSQLSFDTPDEQLPYHFSSFDDQSAVFQGIQHRHLLCLRSLAQSVEAGILLQGEATERDVSSYQPQDFLLCEGSEQKLIGETVYYSLHSPKLPGRVFGLRVHKHTDGASCAHQPSHVNVKDVIVHFQPSKAPTSDSSVLQTQDPSHLFQSDCSAAKPPGAGSKERTTDCMNTILPSVQSFLQRGLSVSVERDLPHATLEDFVQESRLPGTDCLDYDRQVCVLLLQILMGSQHLCNISASAAELKPQEIFLVWARVEMGRGKTEKKEKIQMLWRTRGSPRVLLTPLSPAVSGLQLLTTIKSQLGALIQYCLDSQEGSGQTMSKSLYRRGLLYLASQLQSENGSPQMADMVATLKVLLWGPHIPLFNHRGPVTTAVHNWMIIKRALLVMKFAERGLVRDQSVLNWEDCMCLQYLSFTDHETVVSTSRQLWLTLNVD